MGMKFSVQATSDSGGSSAFSSVPEEIKSTGKDVEKVAETVTTARGHGIPVGGYGTYTQVQKALSSRSAEWQRQLEDWERALTALGRTAYWSAVEIQRYDQSQSESWNSLREDRYLRR